MTLDYQLLYHKSLSLRAGETIKIFLGESVPVLRAHFRVDLESASPKTIVVIAPNSDGNNSAIIKHFLVGKLSEEFDMTDNESETGTFDEVHVSVPEDTQVHLGIYLKNKPGS